MRSIAPLAMILSLAACSGQPTEAPAPAAVAAAPEAAPPPEAVSGAGCAASSLALSVVSQDAGAGSRFATLAVRNTGATGCTPQSYPDLALIGADGQPRAPFRFEQSSGPGDASPLTLEPGGEVWFDMRTTAVAGEVPGETEPCPEVTAVRLMSGGASVDAPIQLNPCNQRASVTSIRTTLELPAPQ